MKSKSAPKKSVQSVTKLLEQRSIQFLYNMVRVCRDAARKKTV